MESAIPALILPRNLAAEGTAGSADVQHHLKIKISMRGVSFRWHRSQKGYRKIYFASKLKSSPFDFVRKSSVILSSSGFMSDSRQKRLDDTTPPSPPTTRQQVAHVVAHLTDMQLRANDLDETFQLTQKQRSNTHN